MADDYKSQKIKTHHKNTNEEALDETAWDSELEDHHARKVTGVAGVKSKPFAKKFKNQAHQDKFFDHPDNEGNFDVHHVTKLDEADLDEYVTIGAPSAASRKWNDSVTARRMKMAGDRQKQRERKSMANEEAIDESRSNYVFHMKNADMYHRMAKSATVDGKSKEYINKLHMKASDSENKAAVHKDKMNEAEQIDEINVGDFVRPNVQGGELHRVFGKAGNSLSVAKYHGPDQYGGSKTLHVSKAVKAKAPIKESKMKSFVDYVAESNELNEAHDVELKPHANGTHYTVHKVDRARSGIHPDMLKTGEKLSDTHVDDLRDMGYKVKIHSK